MFIKSFFNAKRQRAQQKGLKFGCFVGNLSEEVGGVNPAIAEAAAEFHENLRMLISRNLEEAKQSDELKTNLDVNVLSGFIVSSWQGALLRAKVADDKSVLDDFCMVLEKELL